MAEPRDHNSRLGNTWRERWYEIIFEADTPAGKLFDVVLLVAILLSVLVVMLESVKGFRDDYGRLLLGAEWFFTLLFTVEYVVRIFCARRPLRYIFSFYGVVDLLAVVPTYFMALYPGSQRLTVVRVLRLLRAFRIFKLAHLLSESQALQRAIWASRAKLSVFMAFVLTVVIVMGAAMHVIEGPQNGFTSIPEGMYWAIVTMTTVGYGDVAPSSPLGKALAAFIMLLGYSLIVVPTGIVSAELAQASRKPLTTQVCPECMREGHDADATHCKYCGTRL